MRAVVILGFFLLLTSSAVQAQQKIYYTLGSKFKGLRQDQVKITSSFYHEARFVYNSKKYLVFFNPDSSLYEIEEYKNTTCPAYITTDLSCFYPVYKVEDWVVREKYNNELIEECDTLVFVFVPGKSFYQLLTYRKGVKPSYSDDVTKSQGGYQFVDIASGSGINSGHNWYGGSPEAFADYLKKFMVFTDQTCIGRFNNQTYDAFIIVGTDGLIKYHGINNLVPYILEYKFDEFCNSIKFPSDVTTSSGYTNDCCRYDFKIMISNNEIIALPGKD